MGITATLCRVDDDGRLVFEGEEAEELGLDENGYLQLDKAWAPLQTMLASVTSTDAFNEEQLGSDDVARLAKVLKTLTWQKALTTCEMPDAEDWPQEELQPYFEGFRVLVLAAAEEGSGLLCEMT